MVSKKDPTGPYRRYYRSAIREQGRVYEILAEWLYRRGKPKMVEHLCQPFEDLINEDPAPDESYFTEFYRAVLAEARGHLGCAIEHRLRANEKILVGHRSCSHDFEQLDLDRRTELIQMLKQHIAESFDHLKRLYNATGQADKLDHLEQERSQALAELDS